MENHPIPQDVTGFKFKLIGSVTIKQFLYLLGFGIITTVIFVLPLNLFARIPFMILTAGIGIALAFVPIEGRPMDTMIINFIRALPSENRYIFRKRGASALSLAFFQAPQEKVKKEMATKTRPQEEHDEKKNLLLKKLAGSSFKPEKEEAQFFKNIKDAFVDQGAITAPRIQKMPDQTPVEIWTRPKEIPVIKADAAPSKPPQEGAPQNAQINIEKLKQDLEAARMSKDKASEESQEEIARQIIQLEGQLRQALAAIDAGKKPVIKDAGQPKNQEPSYLPSEKKPQENIQAAKSIAPGTTLKAGFPILPDIGNVVLGMVKDARGKTLPNILVEVVDKNNIPVRAFKTNALGQFASATPLNDGTYKIYFEDPTKQHEFEAVEINLTGDIFNPIEATSVDMREKLRRELFDGQTATNG